MSLPSFLIIGAMKAGTTSLHQYLSDHPAVFMSKDKELNFFNTSLNWSKGVDWYKAQFDDRYEVRGETSPNYSKWEGTAERVYSILPTIKLIYVLRNPVQRFVSQCNDTQVDPNSLVTDLKQGIQTEIFTNGLYHKWYEEYLKFYPKTSILLVTSEALRKHKKETLTTVFNFLKVDANTYDYIQLDAAKENHVTSNKKIASSSVQSLNSTKGFGVIKKIVAPIKPLLQPLWNRLFYTERTHRDLTPENRAFLQSLYQADLRQLNEITGTNFYDANA